MTLLKIFALVVLAFAAEALIRKIQQLRAERSGKRLKLRDEASGVSD